MNRLRFFAKSLIHGAIDLSGRPRLQRQRIRQSLIILTYHSFCNGWPRGLFNSLPVSRFEKQVRFLKKNFNLVSLQKGIDNLRQGRYADKPYLAITIDDGFQDNFNLAWPILRHHDVPATIFLATDFIDTGRSPWPTQLKEALEHTQVKYMETPFRANINNFSMRLNVAQQLKKAWGPLSPEERFEKIKEFRKHLRVDLESYYPPLTWEQIKRMRVGGIEYGSHTVYHSILPVVDSTVMQRELYNSKLRIEDVLQEPCTLFAYPDGKHSVITKEALLSSGYRAAVTQDFGFNKSKQACLELKRIEVPYDDPLLSFRARVSFAIGFSKF